MKNGVSYVQNLNEFEISEVKALIKFYNEEKEINFKFDPGFLTNKDEEANHVLFYKDDVLVGYMSVDCYNGEDVEAAPITNSEAVFHQMHQCLVMNAKGKGKKVLLYIVEKKFHFLHNCLENRGIRVSFSEHRMELDHSKFNAIPNGMLEIRDAETRDKRAIFELDSDAFGHPNGLEDESVIEKMDVSLTKIASLNNEIIGKIKIFERDGTAGIYGFVIYPHLRGKGYGKTFLSEIISKYLKHGCHKIFLEVETENKVAVHLYQSLGFTIQSTFDYYSSKIE